MMMPRDVDIMFHEKRGPLRSAVACLLTTLVVISVAPAQTPKERSYRLEKDLVFSRTGGVELKLDAFLPKTPAPYPAVVVIHGGGWRAGNKGQLRLYAIRLAQRGMAAFAISYRLAPKHKFPAQIDDCREAVRWVIANAKKYDVDPGRIGALGYSAGGHLAAMLATQGVDLPSNGGDADATKPSRKYRLKAVVAGGAPCDFRWLPADLPTLAFWLGGTRAEKEKAYEQASPAAFVSAKSSPTFFFHGENDVIVPIRAPQRMTERLKEAGAQTELHVVEGAGHILATLNPTAFGKAMDFMAKHLKPRPDAGKKQPSQ